MSSSRPSFEDGQSKSDQSFVCLDRKNISPSQQTQIEPCDLFSVRDGTATFHHVKVSTFSSELGHLFNQGSNAIELIKLEPEAVEKLKSLLKDLADKDQFESLIAPLIANNHHVTFAIVTHKDAGQKSKNLPLFSRISLMRNMKALQLMSVRANYCFIEDRTPKTDGKKKKRKLKA